MPDRELKEFIRAKEAILDNMEALLMRVDDCQDLGLIDEKSALYNQILDIMDEAQVSSTFEELEEVIAVAKDIEFHLDSYLLRHGVSTMDLQWPQIKPYME